MSAEPFLVYPTHYHGEPNYFSDTEDSIVIDKGEVGEQKESEEDQVEQDENTKDEL